MTRLPPLKRFMTTRIASLIIPDPEKLMPLPENPIPLALFLRRFLRKPPPWGALAQLLSIPLLISAHVPLPFFFLRFLRKAPVPDILIPFPVLVFG